MTESPEWVFVVDDDLSVREALSSLIRSVGLRVETYPSAAAFLEAERPPGVACLILDVRMPPTNTDEGIRAALELRRRRRGFPVVLLSQYVEHVYLDELLGDGAGAIGYLLKDRVFDDVSFVESLRTVAAGGTVVDPEVIVTLMQRQAARGRLSALTPRETEVLSRMAQGDANTSIAERLVITEKAVLKHINAIFSKLGLAGEATSARRVMAVLAFLRGR